MPVLTANEQELYDFGRDSLPKWFWSLPRSEEEVVAMAKVLNAAREETDLMVARTFILEATGMWLDQHAADRGLRRQAGETDEALAERIRNVEDAVTRPTLLAAVQAILEADGVVGAPAAMVELRRDKAFLGGFTERLRTGATFGSQGGLLTVLPDSPFETPIEVGYGRSGRESNPRVYIADWPAGGALEEVPLEVVALSGDTLVVNAAATAPGHDAIATVHLWKYDEAVTDVARDFDPPRARAYAGRGYRAAHRGVGFVVILPYGTSQGTADSVADMLRTKKAAGVRSYVERRSSP